MKILFDTSPETMYPLAKEGFTGGSQVYVKAIIKGLVAKGHTVHVIAPDLEVDGQRGEREFWWPVAYHPHKFDCVVMQMHMRENPPYQAPILVLMTSYIVPYCGPEHAYVGDIDAMPVFSEVHKKLICQHRPIPPEKCVLTGLGVDLADYPKETRKVPGRMLYANDPARGLFYALDIFDLVKKEVPEATLHVAYNFDWQMQYHAWEHSQMAEMLWDCKRRMESTPGVVNLGALSRQDIIREHMECQVHCMPSDPPAIGTQTHGIMQMECAAAGAALVLSDVEAFPEVFGKGAFILPRIGQFVPDIERRITAQDYAGYVIGLMTSRDAWQMASRKARRLAEQNTWSKVVARWDKMLRELKEKVSG